MPFDWFSAHAQMMAKPLSNHAPDQIPDYITVHLSNSVSSHVLSIDRATPQSSTHSFTSLISLLDLRDLNDSARPSVDFMLPGRPDSPFMMSFNDDGSIYSASYLPRPPTLSKRSHALLELLQSEREYSSDLALIRDVHIPLAIGMPISIGSAEIATLTRTPYITKVLRPVSYFQPRTSLRQVPR